MNKDFKVLAIISSYNEEDIIFPVIEHLINNDLDVYLIDHCSTDNTVLKATQWLNKGLINIEKFPVESGYPEELKKIYAWKKILERKEILSSELDYDWYIHHDADEFRYSPWKTLNLNRAIQKVDKKGYNLINFKLYNFVPTNKDDPEITDVKVRLKYYKYYPSEYDRLQIKCWKNYKKDSVNIKSSGGHNISYLKHQQKIFNMPFILCHYPVRSQKHGIKKVFKERKARFCPVERSEGNHLHYDYIKSKKHSFVEIMNVYLFNLEKEQNVIKRINSLYRETTISSVLNKCRDTNILFECAYNYYKASKFKLALEVFSFLLKNKKINSILKEYSFYNVVKILIKLKKTNEALKIIKKISLKNIKDQFINQEIYPLYANLLQERSLYQEAIEQYKIACKKIVELKRKEEILINISICYANIGNVNEANKFLDKVSLTSLDRKLNTYRMASILKSKGFNNKARTIFVNIDVRDLSKEIKAGINYHLGSILSKKNAKAAIKYLKKCTKQNPQHFAGKNLLNKLQAQNLGLIK